MSDSDFKFMTMKDMTNAYETKKRRVVAGEEQVGNWYVHTASNSIQHKTVRCFEIDLFPMRTSCDAVRQIARVSGKKLLFTHEDVGALVELLTLWLGFNLYALRDAK